IDLEDFRMSDADTEEEDAFRPRHGEDGRAAFHLLADVIAPVANGLEPTIGFFGHRCSPLFFQNCSCSSGPMFRVPERERCLMVAKFRFSGCTPPVAVSNSAAVMSSRLASPQAWANDMSAGLGLPHFSRKLKMALMLPLPEPLPAKFTASNWAPSGS